MKTWLLWGLLGLAVAADPAPFVVKPLLLPPEAEFSVRHASGQMLPGGPDPRARLVSGTEFLVRDLNGQRGIILAVRHPGYLDFEQTYPLAQGGEYWVESLHGWKIPIELVPKGPLGQFRHLFRFHPFPLYGAIAMLGAVIAVPLWHHHRKLGRAGLEAQKRETAALQAQREAQEIKDRYDPDLVGREVGGYRVLAKLGEGAYSQVFLAEHQSYGDHFALKIIRPYMVDQETIQRVHREMEIGRTLNHPHLVRIAAFGDYLGSPYLVMDYVEGETLSARLARAPIERAEVLTLFRQICEGVAYAHSHGVIHRDLKPENIMLAYKGPLKILDFGVARPTTKDLAKLTGTGQAVGTPAYMAPEQLLGHPTLSSDIYALGVILFQMLTGRLPTEGGARLSADTPPPLAALCTAMLERKMAKRPTSISEIIQQLELATAC